LEGNKKNGSRCEAKSGKKRSRDSMAIGKDLGDTQKDKKEEVNHIRGRGRGTTKGQSASEKNHETQKEKLGRQKRRKQEGIKFDSKLWQGGFRGGGGKD